MYRRVAVRSLVIPTAFVLGHLAVSFVLPHTGAVTDKGLIGSPASPWPDRVGHAGTGTRPGQHLDPSARAAGEVLRRTIRRHQCWTGAAPADVTHPGGVVVTLPGRPTPQYKTGPTVGRALDHVFGTRPANLTVHAFCR